MLKNTKKDDSPEKDNHETKEHLRSYTEWLESQQDSEVDGDDELFC